MKILAAICAAIVLGTVALNAQKADAVLPTADYVLVVEEPPRTEEPLPPQEEAITILLKTKDGVEQVALEDYLVGVLLSELPSSFEAEAFKAQAVAARTFAARNLQKGKHADCTVCADPGCCQAWRSESQLRSAFGSAYDAAAEKARTAVEQTKGQVLCYDGALIEAVYYSCSGGRTEPAVAVWGTDVPYLQAVESPGEEEAVKFSSTVRVPFNRFRSTLKRANSEVNFPVIPEDWVGETVTSSGGGVRSIRIGGVSFTGTRLRSLFSLPSTLFTLSVGDGEMVFHVKGYGHRVGMSQYGADAMARTGNDYRAILHHYYTDVSIKKLSRVESGQLRMQDVD